MADLPFPDRFLPALPAMKLDEIIESLKNNLIADDIEKQFKSKFAAKTSFSARVKYCYQYLYSYSLLPKKPKNTKCDQLAIDLKNEGNKFYCKFEYNKALVFYNNALKCATDPEVMNLIYANRSAVFFSLKKYKECLLEIERAFKTGYKTDIKKLLSRKEQCEENLKNVLDSSDDFNIEDARKKLFYVSKKNTDGIACASDSVKINSFQTMGRGVIATKDIRPGQVLVREEPYCKITRRDKLTVRCSFCCSPNDSMIACTTCTYVMYCNENCRSESWNQGHKFECPIMSRLIYMKFSHLNLLALRTVLKARFQQTSWKNMFDMIELIENETNPEMKGFLVNDHGASVYDSESYAPIHMFQTNYEKIEIREKIHEAIAAALLFYMLKHFTAFFEDHPIEFDDILMLNETDYIWQVGGILLQLSMSLRINEFSPFTTTMEWNRYETYADMSEIFFARGAYAFTALFNHSCTPNARIINHGTDAIIVAIKPIGKGQQIFITYGPDYAQHELWLRRSGLEKYFLCQCEACVNNWPTFQVLKKAVFHNEKEKRKFRNIIDKAGLLKIKNNDKEFAFHIIQDLYKFIALLDRYVPCDEHFQHEIFIRYCWALLLNDNPCQVVDF